MSTNIKMIMIMGATALLMHSLKAYFSASLKGSSEEDV
jgi:hypothetical protein